MLRLGGISLDWKSLKSERKLKNELWSLNLARLIRGPIDWPNRTILTLDKSPSKTRQCCGWGREQHILNYVIHLFTCVILHLFLFTFFLVDASSLLCLLSLNLWFSNHYLRNMRWIQHHRPLRGPSIASIWSVKILSTTLNTRHKQAGYKNSWLIVGAALICLMAGRLVANLRDHSAINATQ